MRRWLPILMMGGWMMMDTASAADEMREGVNGKDLPATRTVCFGRFVADIPADARIIGSGAVWFWNRLQIEKKSHAQYLKDYDALKASRLSTKHKAFGNLFSRELNGGDQDKAIFYWDSEYAVEADGKSYQAISWRNGHEYKFEGSEVSGHAERYEAAARKFFSTIEYRDNDVVPDRPGFCFEHGFIADDGTSYQNETATLGIRWRDVRITLDSMPLYKPGQDSLLERVKKAVMPEALKPYAHMVKELRARPRETAHLSGEELLETYPTEEGGRQHLFRFEADAKLHDLYSPVLTVKMATGVRDGTFAHVDAEMTDKEAMMFFDAIVESVRLRVPRPGTASGASAPRNGNTSSALQVPSGERAPHTGRYRHAREGALTPSILHIQQGQRLPPVELEDPRSLLERLRGKPAVLAEDVVWEWLPDVPEKDAPAPD